MRIVAVLVFSACFVAPAFAQSTEYNGQPRPSRAPQAIDQIIVKWRSGSPGAAATGTSRVGKLAASSGLHLHHEGQITADTEVLKLERPLDEAALQSLLAVVSLDPDVEYAAPNRRRHAHALPTDPLVGEQWYFLNQQVSATRTEQAWDVTTGSDTTIVAVIDTGVRFEHPDLGRAEQGGKLLHGFDFVSRPAFANDTDGRDDDPSDPGDWVSASDAQQAPFTGQDCIPAGQDHVDSSWHGTRVASLIGALTNDAVGVAGAGWSTLLLPVRVLGKCGGFDDDIIAGMRWAAGLPVFDAPMNPAPATLINLSLGGEGPCSAAYQAAIGEILGRGVLIVASVGNEGGPISAPANCSGVLGVTGLRHAGTKVGFSNLGPQAGIGAPGGNCVNPIGQPCLFSIVVATNTGLTTPATSSYTNQVNFNVGTSFSAPLVAGAAALMHSLNARLSPAAYVTLLKESSTPFPTGSATTTTTCQVPAGDADLPALECICTTQTCGAGMLNTHAAVLAAQRPFAIALAPSTIDPGTEVTIDARTSFASNNRTISVYQWSALDAEGAVPVFTDASQALTTLMVSGNSEFTLRLTVMDDQGAQDTTDLTLATRLAPAPDPPPAPPPPAPAPIPPVRASGGGGGSVDDAGSLLLGWALVALACLRRGSRRSRLSRLVAERPA